jgi:hypothetical protein
VALGRDEKDVGVRSLSCGVAGNQVAQLVVAAGAGCTHAAGRNLILLAGAPLRAALVQEWYTWGRELSSNPMNDSSHSIGDLERAVSEKPDDVHALVALANAYWLSGHGPEVVADLASRAIAADPENRAGWHLWALSEPDPRQRVARWQQVSARFPADDLARANMADNATSLAGAEHDYDALDLAIATYEQLLTTAQHQQQREALDTAIRNLRGWKF